jgi:hypothetical protein
MPRPCDSPRTLPIHSPTTLTQRVTRRQCA